MNKTGEIEIGERIISFERAETNHCQNNSPMRRQFTLHIICINFQVVFFADNFREYRPLTHFMKEHSSYIILLNQGRCIYFLKGTRL